MMKHYYLSWQHRWMQISYKSLACEMHASGSYSVYLCICIIFERKSLKWCHVWLSPEPKTVYFSSFIGSPFSFFLTGFLPHICPCLLTCLCFLFPTPCPSSCHISTTFSLETDNNSNTTQYLQQMYNSFLLCLPACSFHLTSHIVSAPLLLLSLHASRSRDAPVEVERQHQAQASLLGNTSCHGLCQFSSIQLLSALSVYIGCLQLLSQCGTGTRQGGLFCVVYLLPCSRVLVFNINETIEQGLGKFILEADRFWGKNNKIMSQMSMSECLNVKIKINSYRQ